MRAAVLRWGAPMLSVNRRNVVTSLCVSVVVASERAGDDAEAYPSELLSRYRAAREAEFAAQTRAIAAYDAWVAQKAPEFGDYDGLEKAFADPAREATARSMLAPLVADDGCKARSKEWSRCEAEACALHAALRDRTPRTIKELAEAVEVFRDYWGWAPSEPLVVMGEEIIVAEDLAIIFAAIERLSMGGAHG